MQTLRIAGKYDRKGETVIVPMMMTVIMMKKRLC